MLDDPIGKNSAGRIGDSVIRRTKHGACAFARSSYGGQSARAPSSVAAPSCRKENQVDENRGQERHPRARQYRQPIEPVHPAPPGRSNGQESAGFLIDPSSVAVARQDLQTRAASKSGQRRRALPFLEPGQGLTGVAPEQPIVFAAAGIEDGQGRCDVAAGATGLLLLDGLALLASVTAFRLLIHVIVALNPCALGDLTSYKASSRS